MILKFKKCKLEFQDSIPEIVLIQKTTKNLNKKCL